MNSNPNAAETLPGGGAPGGPQVGQVGPNVKRFAASVVLVVAGILLGISIGSPWWSLSGNFGGASGTIRFLPGDSFEVSASGISATSTYASFGWGPVGGLYEGVLALSIVLTILALLTATIGLIGSLGRLRSVRWHGAARTLVLLVTLVTLVSVIIVPALQPTLFHRSSPGACSGNQGPSPCGGFWGSVNQGGVSASWGADLGWYLAISALVLSIAAAALWLSSSREPWGRSIAAGFYGGAQWPGQPQAGSTVDLDRLARLKQMVDSGHLTQEEFQQVKARILGPPVIAGAMPPSAATSPAEELQRLKSLHDSGVLTDSEYDELRKRAVARL